MPIYSVDDPIKHDGDRFEIGSEVELTEEQASALPVSGPVNGGEVPEEESTPEPTPTPSPDPEPEPESSDLINVNTASLSDLTAISGIGDSMAQSIIDLRPIDDLAILSEIPRFRDEWLEKMEV